MYYVCTYVGVLANVQQLYLLAGQVKCSPSSIILDIRWNVHILH